MTLSTRHLILWLLSALLPNFASARTEQFLVSAAIAHPLETTYSTETKGEEIRGTKIVHGDGGHCTLYLKGDPGALVEYSPIDNFSLKLPLRQRETHHGRDWVYFDFERKCVKRDLLQAVQYPRIPNIVCKSITIECSFLPGTAPRDHAAVLADEFKGRYNFTYQSHEVPGEDPAAPLTVELRPGIQYNLPTFQPVKGSVLEVAP